jgi:hypothetical protein
MSREDIMDWNCTESDKRLSDYLERLTTPEETAAFSAHLEHCAGCTALVARVGATVRLLRAAEPVEVPPQLFAKIINATSGASPSARGWRRWIRPVAMAWQPQFAMGAITVAASFLIIFHAASASRGPQNFATLNPLNLFRAADRQAHLTYAHTAKFVSDMRLVYEIESRFEPDQDQESEPSATPPAQAPGSNSQPESQPKSEAIPRPNSARAFRGRALEALAQPESLKGRNFTSEMEPAYTPASLTVEESMSPSSTTAEDFYFSASRSRS